MDKSAAAPAVSKVFVQQRLRLLGLGERELAAIAELATPLKAGRDEFIRRLYDHLGRFETTAALLSSPARIERLKTQQARYFDRLLVARYDKDYVAERQRIGVTHHSVHLDPKWYLGTYCHYICDHLPLIVDVGSACGQPTRHLRAFLRAILFDAGLALDAYSAKLSTHPAVTSEEQIDVERNPAAGRTALSTVDQDGRISTGVLLTQGELGVRKAFLGLTAEHGRLLRDNRQRLRSACGKGIERFYAVVPSLPGIERLFDQVDQTALRKLQQSYWEQFCQAQVDQSYAVSRVRVGSAHERIGLPPHAFLAGLSHSLDGLIQDLEHESRATLVPLLDAVMRAVFLDCGFVIDAYMARRLETLLYNKHFADRLLTRIPTGVLVVDESLRVNNANPALIEMFGLQGELLLGMRLKAVLPALQLEEKLRPVFAGASPSTLVLVADSGPQSSRVYRVSTLWLSDAGGSDRRLAIVVDDVSELAALGRHAHDTESRFGELARDVDAFLWETDSEAKTIELVAGRVRELTGFPPHHWLGSGIWRNHLAPPDRQRWDELSAPLVDSGTGSFELEHRLRTAGGDYRWFLSKVRMTGDSSQSRRMRGVTIDATERVAARQEQARELERAQHLAELMRNSLVLRTRQAMLREVVRTVAKSLGKVSVIALERAENGTYRVTASHEMSDTGESTNSATVREAIRGVGSDELFGQSLLIDDATRDPRARPFQSLIDGPVRWLCVTPLQRGSTLWGALMAYGLEPHQVGDVESELLNATALIATLARDRELAEHEALENHKLAALGTLSSGVAHTFNNILATFQFVLDAWQGEADDATVNGTEKERLQDAVNRGSRLVRQVSEYCRSDVTDAAPTNLTRLVEVLCEGVRRTNPPSLEVKFSAQAEVHVLAHPSQLEQILIQLVDNARLSMNLTGRIDVTVASRQLGQEVTTRFRNLPAGDYVKVRVCDSGPGISEQHLSRIFDPFFTTRPEGQGTGLGLFVVHGLVRALGGGITVESNNQGTCFEVLLPAVERASSSPPPDATDRAGHGTVLVVEHDPQLGRLLARRLIAAGFEVITHESPNAALEWTAGVVEPTLVLTDCGMSDPELALVRALRAQHLDLPVVMLADGLSGQPSRAPPGVEVVTKPLALDKLLHKIHQLTRAQEQEK